ncbi:FliM/FliN family flagellar motor switch protein [Pseudomonas hormoni]|uniref:Surface presentation of antigens protein SpaO n=1 Tax=Pseudomonas hormoni TaxID=3093767 RepID=A0ABX8EZF2_9PSED|nr:FliM/FliN family flagellar motor switch protein [Pseudomonas hormoni]QVW25109.1 FliM/FliN family flagellar motor switch protein [Pseudomonas hormoni]
MRALTLRRVDASAHARRQAVQRWRHAGHGAGMGRPDRLPGYLQFFARSNEGDWRGLILARDWLHRSLPQLPSLLTVECPVTSIVELFRAVPRPLPRVGELSYQALVDLQLIAPTELPTHDLPWLDTPHGRVWLTQLPPTQASNNSLGPESWLADLPLRLQLLLGFSHLRYVRLGQGDVLRITHQTNQCLLATQCIGVFTFTEEGLHMQSTVTDSNQQVAADAEAGVELGALPVRLEFLLATHEIDLGTLSQIIDGQLIPLAADAARHIEVRANGKRVARGELVQLDD